MDDGDSKKQTHKTIKDIQRGFSYVSDVLSPLWVRRFIQIDNGFKWFILGCRYRFLFNFRLFLVILYLTFEIFKN
jgi:hypothetical protein